MMTIDWGDTEEKLLIVKIQGAWHMHDFNMIMQGIADVLLQKSYKMSLIIDMRSADPIDPHIARALYHKIHSYSSNLQHIIAITRPHQANSLRLIANFYPSLTSDIMIVESVDQAYAIVSDVA